MKNIPIFTACGGTATLILREIPRLGRAYVILQTSTPGQEAEQAAVCAGFCRQFGAREVFVSSREQTALPLPHSHDMCRRTLPRAALTPPERPIALVPPDEALAPLYLQRYAEAFAPVLNASMLTHDDLSRAAAEGSRFFLAQSGGQWVGLGQVCGAELQAVASFCPGWGCAVTQALLAETQGDPITLLVCSANARAMVLYDRLGFTPPEIVSQWYRI